MDELIINETGKPLLNFKWSNDPNLFLKEDYEFTKIPSGWTDEKAQSFVKNNRLKSMALKHKEKLRLKREENLSEEELLELNRTESDDLLKDLEAEIRNKRKGGLVKKKKKKPRGWGKARYGK